MESFTRTQTRMSIPKFDTVAALPSTRFYGGISSVHWRALQINVAELHS
jgi:hypothetical protein